MQFSHETLTIKSRMTTNRIILTIVFFIGAVLLTGVLVTGSFTGSAFIWLFALLVSRLYISQIGNFQINPNKNTLKYLSAVMYSFVAIWVLAFITSLDGRMEDIEVLAVFLAIFGTYLMYQLRTDAKGIIVLQQVSKPQITQHTEPAEPPKNICPNCGTIDDANFCQNCGTKLLIRDERLEYKF